MNFLKPNKTILCMLQPPALPGSYRHKDMSINAIVDAALAQCQMIKDNNFDGVILQNMNDMPIKHKARPEAIAYMTRIALEIRRAFPQLILGLLLNWDGAASLCVAEAVGADFIRVEHLFTGASVTSAGILEAQCVKISKLRKRLGSTIPVFADVQEIHGVALGAKSIEDAAWECVHEAFADGLFLAGKSAQESIEMIKKVRTRLKDIPIFVGGGSSADNIKELMAHFDGVSVATWIKNGDMKNPIDKARAELFIKEARAS